MDMNEYLSSLEGPYFERGLLSRVKIGNDFKIRSSATGRLYDLTEEGLKQAYIHTAKLGINEAQILAGSALDPFGYEHLGQTNIINEFLERSSSNYQMQQVLEDAGLGSLRGRRIEVERLAYSDINTITHGESNIPYPDGTAPKGIRLRLKELHDIQRTKQEGIALPQIINPDFVAGGTNPRYIPLPKISLEGALNENESTFGFLTTRDSNAVALRYRFINEEGAVTYLTQAQYTKLSVAMGGEAISRSAMMKIGLKNPYELSENMDSLINYDPLKELGGLFQKLDKRISASTSSRDLSLAGGQVDTLIEAAIEKIKTNNPELYERLKSLDALPKTLDDLFIKTDFTESRLLEAFKLDDGKSLFEDFTEKAISANAKKELSLTANLRIIKGVGQDELNVSAESIRGILKVAGVDEAGFQSLGAELKKYYASDKGGAEFKIDDFIEHLKTLDLPGSNEFARIAKKLGDGERVYDGSGVLADFAVKHKLTANGIEIGELEAIISTHKSDAAAGEAEIARIFGDGYGIDHVKKRLADVKSATRKIAESHDDLTARIGLSQGGVKAVLDVRDISHVSDDLGVIGFGSKELFKRETNFGRANWSLFGEAGVSGQYISLDSARHFPGERVFSDFQASIFHPEVYSNQQLVEQVKENMAQFSAGIQTMKDTGVVPESILKSIDRQASLNPDDFEQLGFHSRSMAMRYRQDALEIQAAIRNGARPTELPDLLNKIIETSSKEVFRKGKQYKSGVDSYGKAIKRDINAVVLPNAQRHAVDTEENLIGRGLKKINKEQSFDETIGVGRKAEDALLLNQNAHKEISLANSGEILRMPKYRHDDHKIIVGGSTLDELYEAKGGFDLDDKFITDLHYINSNEIDGMGNPVARKRLAAFSFRQPTGPEEFSILAPQMDNKTIARMFGGQDQLGENFREALMTFNEQMDQSTGINLIYTNKNKEQFAGLLTDSGMTQEQRAVRYLNAISRNNMKLADIYRNGENGYISDDVIEDMIIRISERSNLGPGKGLINELSQNLIAKTVVDPKTGIRMSTARQLTEADFADDPSKLAAYRNSRRIQIQDSSLTISEDQGFVDAMKNIVNSNKGKGVFDNDYLSNATFEEHAQFYKELQIDGKPLGFSETTTAHYLASLGVRSEDTAIENSVLEQMMHLKTRLAEQATTQKSGSLGSYIDTLGFTTSFERQMDDILKSSTMTPEDVNFFKSHYFAYDPESAIDAAIGGNAKIQMTQMFEEVVKSQEYFETVAGVNAEESTAKAFFQLYNLQLNELKPEKGVTADSLRPAGYDKNWKSFFDSDAAKILDEYEGLEDFTVALKDTHKKAKIMQAIEAQSAAISRNMIRQTGVEFGKMRMAFHSGTLGTDEFLRMGMDELVFRTKGSNSKDVEEFLRGIMRGSRSYADWDYGATKEAEDFYNFIKSSLKEFKSSPNFDQGETYESVQQKALQRLLGNERFGLAYKGEDLLARYRSSTLESAASQFGIDKEALKIKRTGDTAFTEMLKSKSQAGRDANVANSLTGITEGNLLKKVSLTVGEETIEPNLIEKIGKLNSQIRAVTNNLNFGSRNINQEVELLLKDSHLAGVIATFHSPSDKLGYVQAELMREREQYRAAARALIYDHLETQLTSENPVDARSLLEHYYIESQRLTASKNPNERTLGMLMDESLIGGEHFFDKSGRIQLGKAYEAVKSDLVNKVSNSVAKDEEIFNSLITKLEESSGENAAKADDSVSKRLQEILSPRGEHSPEAGLNERGGFVDKNFEDVFPGLTARHGDIKGRSLRELIEETMLEATGGLDINDQQSKKLEHFTQLMYSQDQDTTLSLIRKDLVDQSIADGVGPVANLNSLPEHNQYINQLALMGSRFEARTVSHSQEALDVLRIFEQDLRNPIPVFNDIAARYLSDEVGTAAGTVADLTGPKYTRMSFNAISEKFPNFLNYAKGNKTKIAVGLGIAALGGAVYNKMKSRDHTAEGVAGPPLLPGGSPYERPATETMEYPSFSPTSNGDLGSSYSVDIVGSQAQVQQFINASQSISESGSNATIYSGIPNAGKDPYQEIASSY